MDIDATVGASDSKTVTPKSGSGTHFDWRTPPAPPKITKSRGYAPSHNTVPHPSSKLTDSTNVRLKKLNEQLGLKREIERRVERETFREKNEVANKRLKNYFSSAFPEAVFSRQIQAVEHSNLMKSEIIGGGACGSDSGAGAGPAGPGVGEEENLLYSNVPRIFSAEKAKTGTRTYSSIPYGRFCHKYFRKYGPAGAGRHFYELIGVNDCCRLYFDLEFCKVANPDIRVSDAEMMVKGLKKVALEELRKYFEGTKVGEDSIVDLDSSTPAKFSRHLIFHVDRDRFLFKDNREVGRFVKQKIVARLVGEREAGEGVYRGGHDELIKYLFVKPKNVKSGEDKKDLFIDVGVYTRNRLFRLLGSSKFGKPSSAALRIAAKNKFLFSAGFNNAKFYNGGDGDANRVSASNMKPSGSVDAVIEEKVNWAPFALGLAETLVVPITVSAEAVIGGELAEDVATTQISQFSQLEVMSEGQQIPTVNHRNNAPPVSQLQFANYNKGTSTDGDGELVLVRNFQANNPAPSPFPILDDFVLNTLAKIGMGPKDSDEVYSAPITIGSWSSFNNKLTYQIRGNKFCEIVKRQHKVRSTKSIPFGWKQFSVSYSSLSHSSLALSLSRTVHNSAQSNGIFFTVDLNKGVYFQGCFDIDCKMKREYNSSLKKVVRLPREIDEWLFELKMVVATEKAESVTEKQRESNSKEEGGCESESEDEKMGAENGNDVSIYHDEDILEYIKTANY